MHLNPGSLELVGSVIEIIKAVHPAVPNLISLLASGASVVSLALAIWNLNQAKTVAEALEERERKGLLRSRGPVLVKNLSSFLTI